MQDPGLRPEACRGQRLMKDWDDAFANSAHIPGSGDFPAQWAAAALAYRGSGRRIDLNVGYGPGPRDCFDLVWPDGQPKGLAVFVHGGYWMQSDKSFWTDLAEGARAAGWLVCLPGYALAPTVRISAITRQIGQAISAAAERVAGPIRLAGHSAGGHLVARMICTDTPLSPDLSARIDRTLSISGVHDLRPLRHTRMNATLGLDGAEAALESPALLRPTATARLTCWVGGGERPEFLRQARLMARRWHGSADCVVDGMHSHFSVLDGLRDPASPITGAFVG